MFGKESPELAGELTSSKPFPGGIAHPVPRGTLYKGRVQTETGSYYSYYNDLARAINAAEIRIREEVPTAQYIYIEPDLYVAGYRSAKDSHPTDDTPEPSVGES